MSVPRGIMLGLLRWCSLALLMTVQEVAADPAKGLLPADYRNPVAVRSSITRVARTDWAVGWPGGDDDLFAPIGLNAVNYKKTISDIKALGFNTIRLPWCDMWVGRHASAVPKRTPKFVAIDALHNPELQGLTALQVTDRIVEQASVVGLKIIFDHHNNDCESGNPQQSKRPLVR